MIYRGGARPGAILICVTGDLGSAYMGLLLLEREKRSLKSIRACSLNWKAMNTRLAGSSDRSPDRYPNLLQTLGVHPTAMIDISDGLASETLHLCRRSGTGCRLFEEKIPDG